MTALDQAADAFRIEASTTFDSEADFLDAVTELFRKHAAPLVTKKTVTRTKKAPAADPVEGEAVKPKRRRNVNPYNIFVREMMTTDQDIKDTPAEQRMSAIGARWQKISKDPAALEPYRKKADEENAKRHLEEEAAAATAEAPTTA
jgi:hypothetical protein